MSIYIGCSGYFYKSWIGRFYPSSLEPEELLSFYAEHFNALEITATRQRILSRAQVKGFLQRAKKLYFGIVAYGGFSKSYSRAELSGFLTSLEPLLEEDRLFCVVFELPLGLGFNQDAFKILERISKDFTELPKAVQVRHKSFRKAEFFSYLRDLGFNIVSTDGPKREDFLLGPWLDGEILYVRAFGKELDGYTYSLEELKKLHRRILEVKAVKKGVFFLNHSRASAVLNALQISLLFGRYVKVPESLTVQESVWE
ncbi:MAG: DUF72 domain-containing protein [Aquificaceae bacterium]|nr:DUF72 domain-containing protein [Aquificaceae bacterium]MDW8237060.1 DUF72 domain-containing protein [Aquificaceae bacterium]